VSGDLRRPPVNEIHRIHLPKAAGKCDWCGLPHDERTPVRKQLRLRHSSCDAELQLVQSPEVARRHVFDRDKGVCVDCREDWSLMVLFLPDYGTKAAPSITYADEQGYGWSNGFREGLYPYVGLKTVSLWHVDHKIPLWKVRHMPAAQRIEYFKLHNLVTRCEPCHKIKSRREAAERGKFRELAGENKPNTKPRRKWPKRKMQSRSSWS